VLRNIPQVLFICKISFQWQDLRDGGGVLEGWHLMTKTIVIGLGNPILGDDGIGWIVAAEVKKQRSSSPDLSLRMEGDVDIACLSLGGLSLMERLVGYERAILVDAFVCEERPGSIIVSKLDQLLDESAFHLTSVHDLSLQAAMRLGRQMGVKLPEDVTVVGISARHVFDFSEELSPAVLDSIPNATQIIVELLTQNITIH
jgi:hydrogenase maturation protease